MNSSKNSESSNNDLTCLPTSSSTYMPNSRVCSVCSGPSNGSKPALPNKNVDVETPSAPSSVLNINNLSKIYVNLSFDKSLPTITHFLKSLHDMEVGYKALSSVLGKWDPKLLESHSHVYHIKMQEYMKIRRGEAMLVLSLIREHFPEFDKLSGQTQVKTFPDQTKEIKQMIIHPGCVVDGRRIELFVGEETIQCFDDQKRLKGYNYGLNARNISYMIRDPIEVVERYAPQIDLISEKRNQLYSELLSVLAQRLGSDSAAIGVRYGRIMGLIQNITVGF
uniref:Uncharacterized protein n=1 Tax=Meloidogyne javanica TaxID=6303 RepID=A0A915LF91_MELJA